MQHIGAPLRHYIIYIECNITERKRSKDGNTGDHGNT